MKLKKGTVLRRTSKPSSSYGNHSYITGETVTVIYTDSKGFIRVSRQCGKVGFITYNEEEWKIEQQKEEE